MKKPTPTQKFHLSRLFLFLLLTVSIFIAQNSSGNAVRLTYNKREVLAYATSMSITDLLAATNQARSANGLTQLTLNTQLNNSAQLKANDMIANNYWAHVSPSGVQPWYWFQQAGYTYASAGENLAYGFNTGSEINTAWMNSPTHKDNVLGGYVDVGFGIASGPSYQGSENTVVVAHYGKLQDTTVASTLAPTTAPIPTVPATTPPVATTKPTPTKGTTTATPTTPTNPASAPIQNVPVPDTTTSTDDTTVQTEPPELAVAQSSNDQSVSIFDQIRNGKVTLAILVSIGLAGAAAAGFVLAHRAFMKHLVQNGRNFVLHHPLLDASGIILTIGTILTTTVGHLL